MLTAVAFSEHPVLEGQTLRPEHLDTADLDADGDLDLIVASRRDDRVSWMKNLDGRGTFGAPQVVDDELIFARHASAGDIDGDGNLDIVAAGYHDDVVWYRNLDGSGSFGGRQPVMPSVPNAGAVEVYPVDIDGDGDLDAIAAFGDEPNDRHITLAWSENQDGRGNFGPMNVLDRRSSDASTSVQPVDWNGNGIVGYFQTPDLVGADDIGIGESYLFGARSFSGWIQAAVADDFNNDGLIDVAGATRDRIEWSPQSTDRFGNPQFVDAFLASELLPLDSSLNLVDLGSGDVDNDGDVDIYGRLTADAISNDFHSSEYFWLDNLDGKGTFSARKEITRGRFGRVHMADIDADGDLDAFVADWDVKLYRNHGEAGFELAQNISPQPEIQYALLLDGDVDNDGDIDLVGSRRWYENSDGQGTLVDHTLNHASGAALLDDVDMDGQLDIVRSLSSLSDVALVWHEKLDDRPDFGPAQVIISFPNQNPDPQRGFEPRLSNLTAADIDQDSDLDLVFLLQDVNRAPAKVMWLERLDDGQFANPQLVVETEELSRLAVGDADQDGDIDVLLGARVHNIVSWVENSDGAGNFTTEHRVTLPDETFNGAARHSVGFADLNGDDRLDIFTLSWTVGPYVLRWHPSLGEGEFGPAMTIAKTTFWSTVIAADIDRDGDIDLFDDRHLSWYENLDGQGTFRNEAHRLDAPLIPTSFPSASGRVQAVLADLDGDQDLDVIEGRRLVQTWIDSNGQLIASSDEESVSWWEHRTVGDVDDDGRFDSSDLVAVFQAGKYQVADETNTFFEDGDWNGDGTFDSSDLVLAFQIGHYEFESDPLMGEVAQDH